MDRRNLWGRLVSGALTGVDGSLLIEVGLRKNVRS